MRKSISSKCSVSMRHLALMGMLGTGSLQAHAQNSAIEFVTVYNGPKLGGGTGTSTCCPLPPPPPTGINLPPEPSIAVGQHWIVLAVNYSVFVYRRSDLVANSDPTISCSPIDLPQASHGAYKVTDIIQRFMPGAVGCSSQACDCVNVNVPFGSGNHDDSTVYDVQVAYNPHKAEFAMITGAERQFFLSDGDDPDHRPFCGPACGSSSMDFELVRNNTSNTDIFHRSWLGFDSENYYISHRDGSNGVQLYQLDATTHSVIHSTTAPLTSCPRGIAAVTSYDSNHEVQYPFVGLPGGNGGSPIFFGFDTNGAVV